MSKVEELEQRVKELVAQQAMATARLERAEQQITQYARYGEALREVWRLLSGVYPIIGLDYTKLLLNWGEAMFVIRKALDGEKEQTSE